MDESRNAPGSAGYKVGVTIAQQRKLIVIVICVVIALLVAAAYAARYFVAQEREQKAAQAAAQKEQTAKRLADQFAASASERARVREQMRDALGKRDFDTVAKLATPWAGVADEEMKALRAPADKAIAARNAAAAVAKAVAGKQADLAKRKREGVRIGMTKQEVYESSWGRPDKVNTTTTARAVREQWVYRNRGSGYLYFEDGVLTSIQN